LAILCKSFVVSLSYYQILIHCSRLPPSEEGEWWELADDSRGGLPYYYQTKTGETVWERPEAFVIPLGILQVALFFIVLPIPFICLFRTLRWPAGSQPDSVSVLNLMVTFPPDRKIAAHDL
jgi:hypothetical protein